jgi:hypothetical protein
MAGLCCLKTAILVILVQLTYSTPEAWMSLQELLPVVNEARQGLSHCTTRCRYHQLLETMNRDRGLRSDTNHEKNLASNAQQCQQKCACFVL